jgi:hypothetical protein
MAQLNEAYNTLSDPQKRAAYDASRSFGTGHPGYPPPPSIHPHQAARKIGRFVLLVGIALAALWFGPRLLRLFFPGKKN